MGNYAKLEVYSVYSKYSCTFKLNLFPFLILIRLLLLFLNSERSSRPQNNARIYASGRGILIKKSLLVMKRWHYKHDLNLDDLLLLRVTH